MSVPPPKPLSKPVLLCLNCIFTCFHVKFECKCDFLTAVNSPHMELDMLRKIFRHKQRDKRVVWGIRAPEAVRNRWTLLSILMRVPVNRLVLFVLQDWAKANADILLDDQARNRLADKITEIYLNKKLS